MATSPIPKSLYCIAHRGGLGHGPENTLPAFAHALQLGVDAIEIDVWNVRGELLVTHDRRLGKVIPGRGLLLKQDPAALRAIELPGGARIPTLRETLNLIDGRTVLNIELKGGSDCAAAVAAELEAFVGDRNGSFDDYFVSSFDHRLLAEFRQRLPAVRRGVLLAGVLLDYARCCEALDAWSLHLDIDCLSQPLVDDARGRGLKVFVYTVNEEEDMRSMAAMGVDGVFTDYPEILLALNARVENTDANGPQTRTNTN